MISTRKENNYAFIDSQNLNLSIRNQAWRLDFKRFRVYLEEKYHVKKAFLFIGYIPENQSLYLNLQKDGFILVFKPTLVVSDKKIKGNVDAELVLHTMIEYPHYDQAVIVTGDGDFHCLVDYLAKHHKLKCLMVPNQKAYSRLLKRVKNIVFMNNLREKLGLKK